MRRLPRLISGFVEGATGREVGMANNMSAFDRIKLQPRVLNDVGKRSTACIFLDRIMMCLSALPPWACAILFTQGQTVISRMLPARTICRWLFPPPHQPC